MSNQNIKKSQFFRIVGMFVCILPTLLLLWVVVDLLLFSLVPYPYADGADIYYVLLKESPFLMQYIAHCQYFELKWITSVLWHFSWFISLLGIMIINKYGQKSTENYNDTKASLETNKNSPKKGKLSHYTLLNYINNFQLILLTIGTFVLRFKKWTFYDRSGNLIFGNILFLLIILPPFSILPQFFLSKIISRRSFQKSKLKRDYAIIPLFMICLLISFVVFGRALMCA